MVYGSWSRGYRSGGFNGRGLTPFSATTPYDPETVDSYEIGFKSEFLDRKVSLNVAAFYTDYKDIQQTTTISTTGGTGNETIVTNAASAKIKGIEADLTVRPISDLTIRSSLGYTDSKFGGFVTNQPVFGVVRQFDLSDVNLIYAPKITWSINAEYTVPVPAIDGSIRFNAGYRYITRYDQQVAADPATPIPATGTIIVARNDPRLRPLGHEQQRGEGPPHAVRPQPARRPGPADGVQRRGLPDLLGLLGGAGAPHLWRSAWLRVLRP
jgi:iron complex outermembrane receptor protein